MEIKCRQNENEINKKPHNDATSWQADSSLQGSQITMDSNANHRARITRFSELRQHSRDMSSWLYHQQEKVRGIDDPNAKLLFQRLGHFANDLRGCGSQLLSNITILKIVTAWLICAHVVGICFAVSARLFVPLNKLCPTMQKCYRYSKIILNSNQFLSL